MQLNARTYAALAIACALAALSACTPPATAPNPTGSAKPSAAPGASPAPGARVEAEPNDEFANAQKLDLAATLTADIGGDDQRDFYTFTTPAGVAGMLRTTVTETSEDLRPYWTYFTSSRTELDSFQAPDHTTTPSTHEKALSGGATYFVRLEGASQRAPYQLRLEWVPVNDTFEPNDDFGTAKLLDSGTPVDLTLFAGSEQTDVEDVDFFKIAVPAGKTQVRVEIENRSQTADSQRHHVTLFGPGRNEIASATADNFGANFDRTFDVEGAGEYFLRFEGGARSTRASQLLVTVL